MVVPMCMWRCKFIFAYSSNKEIRSKGKFRVWCNTSIWIFFLWMTQIKIHAIPIACVFVTWLCHSFHQGWPASPLWIQSVLTYLINKLWQMRWCVSEGMFVYSFLLWKKCLFLFYAYECLTYTYISATCRNQKRASDTLEL